MKKYIIDALFINRFQFVKKYSLNLYVLISTLLPDILFAENLYVERLGIEHGLTQNSATAIVQDSKGFIWIGTQITLIRYDGYKFKEYNNIEGDSSSISSGATLSMIIDSKDKLWIGTYSGINLYDASTDRFKSYQHDPNNPQSLSQNSVWGLLEDQNGYIWAATENGLNRFDPGSETFTRFFNIENDTTSISDNVINYVYQDKVGDIWIGTDMGINRYDYASKQFDRNSTLGSELKNSIVTCIVEDKDDRLWVGTSGSGLFIINKQRDGLTHKIHNPLLKDGISSDKITEIMVDSKNRVWIGTSNAGVSLFDDINNRFIHYQHDPSDPHSISENEISSLFEDKSGVIWIGTYTKGISKFTPYGFGQSMHVEYQSIDNPDPHTDIRAFVVDRENSLWVGSSYNGIRVTQANGNKISFKHDPNDKTSLSNNRVYSLFKDSEGVVWVGMINGWLNKYDKDRNLFVHYQIGSGDHEGLRHGRVSGIVEDSKGLLWLALRRGGVHSFNRNTGHVVHYHHNADDKNSMSSNRVFDIAIDRNDNLWFGTYGGGLNHYDQKSKKFVNFRHDPNVKNSIASNYSSSIHVDIKDNIIWVSTGVNGFDKFDMETKSFMHFNKNTHLLSDNNIYGILQTDNGHLWMSHNKGMSYFNTDNETFRNYEQRDGLQSNEYNGMATYKAQDGKLFFGGIMGYNAFYPEEIVENPYKPQILITDFQLFNKSVEVNGQYEDRILLPKVISEIEVLTLSYKDSVFSFEFAALDFVNPSKNQYAYKMDGLEHEWNYVDSNRRFATYTTLPPGKYTFRVKASNNSGVWNNEGASLRIIITPPVWQTWWFRMLVFIGLVGTLFTIYTLRIKAVHKRNKMLKEQVKERTKDLEDALFELSDTKDALIEAAHKAGMADTATGVLHNVGNLLNSVVISAGVIRENIRVSVSKKFLKVIDLFILNKDDLIDYLDKDPQGKKLPKYLIALAGSFVEEEKTLNENSLRLIEKIDSIKDSITAQQRFAQGGGLFVEELSLKNIIEDSLLLQSGSIGRHEIEIIKNYDTSVPKIKVQKAKLVQILINLYKNAKESMDANKHSKSILTIEIYKDDKNVYVAYADTGLGIEKDHLKGIFAYGFTTKKDGYGIGLHSCANYMTEMGGKLWAESDGLGFGAKFILSFPLQSSKPKSSKNSSGNNRTIRKIA